MAVGGWGWLQPRGTHPSPLTSGPPLGGDGHPLWLGSHSTQPGGFTEGSAGGPGRARPGLTDAVPPSAALAGDPTLQKLFCPLPCREQGGARPGCPRLSPLGTTLLTEATKRVSGPCPGRVLPAAEDRRGGTAAGAGPDRWGGRLTGSPAGGFRPVLSHLLEHLLCVCAGEKWPLATGTGAASRRGGTHLGEERAHRVALAQS